MFVKLHHCDSFIHIPYFKFYGRIGSSHSHYWNYENDDEVDGDEIYIWWWWSYQWLWSSSLCLIWLRFFLRISLIIIIYICNQICCCRGLMWVLRYCFGTPYCAFLEIVFKRIQFKFCDALYCITFAFNFII